MTASEHKPLRLLHIEDDPVASALLEAQLGASSLDCKISIVTSMAQALESLQTGSFDLALLDLMLPDSHGLDGLELLKLEADLPIVVMTSKADESLALEALAKGAQDYLFKGEVSTHTVIRSIRYALERHRLTNSIRELSLIDELSGLYNRRGFVTLAQQQLKVAERLGSGVALLLADIDDFKTVNDTYGHIEGDAAIQTVSAALERSFRAADLIARWGGDEFAVFCMAQDPEHMKAASDRLDAEIASVEPRSYPLEVSIGLHWEAEAKVDMLDTMLRAADQALYAEKDRRRSR